MSKLLAAIIALYEIIKLASSFTKKTYKKIYVEKVDEAKKKVVEKKDQRALEEVTFADAGEPSKKAYKGKYIKKAKDTEA